MIRVRAHRLTSASNRVYPFMCESQPPHEFMVFRTTHETMDRLRFNAWRDSFGDMELVYGRMAMLIILDELRAVGVEGITLPRVGV